MVLNVISNTVHVNDFQIDVYLKLEENNFVKILWRVSDEEKILKEDFGSLGHAIFYIDNFLKNKK